MLNRLKTRSLVLGAISVLTVASPAMAIPIVIDNGDSGYSRSGNGFFSNDAGWGYGNDFSWANYDAGNPAQATWQFTGLTSGSYDVYVTWSTRESWNSEAPAAPYTVYDGTVAGSALGTVAVNQSVAPTGLSYDGATWYLLGSFSVSGSQLAVQLNTTATMGAGNAIADAVFIDMVPEPGSLGLLGLAALLVAPRRGRAR